MVKVMIYDSEFLIDAAARREAFWRGVEDGLDGVALWHRLNYEDPDLEKAYDIGINLGEAIKTANQ